VIAIGVMSGTSCDGADAIALELSSVDTPHEPPVVAHAHRDYPSDIRDALLRPELLTAPVIAELHYELAELYAKTAQDLGCVSGAAVCGLHGQTLWHAPPSKKPRVAATLQIGSSALVSHRLGIPVVGDLRGADIAEGGEGAPIVPFSHWFFTAPEHRPRLLVNIGGIANVTVVTAAIEDVIGYDVGPGMMIADAFAKRVTEGRLQCDFDGELSAGGTPIDALVQALMAHPFIAQAPPKSTGREDFGATFFDPILARFADAPANAQLASILNVTARCIAKARAHAGGIGEVVLTGGGAKNPTLVAACRSLMEGSVVRVVERGVLLPDHHEPAAVALIAARTLQGLPSSLPRVTGARKASRLGHIHYPE
jgi:anhydro-N-acetylmuramic acid kinase